MTNPVLQWLGAHPRYTLWQVTSDPFTTTLLGYIQDDGGTWSAWLNVDGEAVKLRTLDDRLAAARTLCAWVRMEMPELPKLSDEED